MVHSSLSFFFLFFGDLQGVFPIQKNIYGKCPRILYTKVSDKIAYENSADPNQTAPKGAV